MKQPITQRILNAAGIPDETLPRQMLLELCGDRRVLIENHRGVAAYGTEEICVRVPFGTVRVSGTQLRLCRMLGSQLIITGRITAIAVQREGNYGKDRHRIDRR